MTETRETDSDVQRRAAEARVEPAIGLILKQVVESFATT
jgi:hypothetical protein